MVARMPRYAPEASGIRGTPRIPASGQNGSSRHVPASSDTSSEGKWEQSSGLLICGYEGAGCGFIRGISAIWLLQSMPRGATGNADRASAARSQKPGPFPCSARPPRYQACTASALCRPSGLRGNESRPQVYGSYTLRQSCKHADPAGHPDATRVAAPATAGRTARGMATRMPCRHVPAARPGGPPDASRPGAWAAGLSGLA
jgi:hypothetical protein